MKNTELSENIHDDPHDDSRAEADVYDVANKRWVADITIKNRLHPIWTVLM